MELAEAVSPYRSTSRIDRTTTHSCCIRDIMANLAAPYSMKLYTSGKLSAKHMLLTLRQLSGPWSENMWGIKGSH